MRIDWVSFSVHYSMARCRNISFLAIFVFTQKARSSLSLQPIFEDTGNADVCTSDGGRTKGNIEKIFVSVHRDSGDDVTGNSSMFL